MDSTGAPIDPQFSEEEGVMNKDEKILECRIEDQQSGTESRIPEGSVDDHKRIGEGDGQAECRIPKEEGDIRIGEEEDVQGRLHR